MSDELMPVATFVRPSEAAAARTALEAEGILCFLKDENIISMDWLLGNAVGYVKLLVPAADVERARALLAAPFDEWPAEAQPETWKCPQCGEEVDSAFARCDHCGVPRQRGDTVGDDGAFVERLRTKSDQRKMQELNPYKAPQSQELETQPATPSVDLPSIAASRLPKCPACDRPRVAVCPYCRTTGSNFAVADSVLGEESAEEPALVICPTCDEPFEPGYLRRCEWCGHDFGEGVDPPRIVRPIEREAINWRAFVAGLVGVAIVVGIVAYFAALLS